MWWLAILAGAYADTLELDSGAQLVGSLAEYDRDGECEIAVDQGELAGAVVVVPCARVVRFERAARAVIEVSEPIVPYVEEVPVLEQPPVHEVPLAMPATPPSPPPAAAVAAALPAATPAAPPAAAPSAPAAQPSEEPSAEPGRRTWLDNLPTFSDPFRR